jgi:polyphenol oxidase
MTAKEKIIPGIFRGLPVDAFFTTRAFHDDLCGPGEGLQSEKAYMPVQRHTDQVLVIENDLEPRVADAVITKRKGLVIGVKVADCVPVLLYDRQKQIAGAVHAGWRGTAEGILRKTIGLFSERFLSRPEDIIMAVGPSIKVKCYPVSADVIEAVTRATGKGDYVMAIGDNHCVDLPSANRQQALSAGILPENIWISDDCTHCLPGRYYSYRYSKMTTGRQYAFISLI